MSMTVHVKMKESISDLDLLIKALELMGKRVRNSTQLSNSEWGRHVLATAFFQGKEIGFARNSAGGIEMVGDDDWDLMRDDNLHNEIMQHYTLASVKRKAKELRYNVASVDRMENGEIRVVCRSWG